MAEHKFQRWYEQNEYLKAFMVLLEDLEPEIQCEIAVDMIMEASNLIDRDYEKIIEEVGEYLEYQFYCRVLHADTLQIRRGLRAGLREIDCRT